MYSAAESAVFRPYCHILRPIVPSRDEDGAAWSSSALAIVAAWLLPDGFAAGARHAVHLRGARAARFCARAR